MLTIKQMSKDYGNGQGIFDINLSIAQGEVFGFVGTNGAGKTTTIRHLMGFLKPQQGSASISGMDCWHQSADIKQHVGYVPGEALMDKLQLDARASLKRMSKGMKQKTAIVAALMTDPQLLILDEPTTGLDPLMRRAFIEILQEEKEKGKTIFMSSHMFDEVEHICDKVAMIKDGRIIAIKATSEMKHNPDKTYRITFNTHADYERFKTEGFAMQDTDPDLKAITITIHDRNINTLLHILKQYDLKRFTENKYTLEQYFKSLY